MQALSVHRVSVYFNSASIGEKPHTNELAVANAWEVRMYNLVLGSNSYTHDTIIRIYNSIIQVYNVG